MGVRDRIVIALLISGAVISVALWGAGAPWAALVIVLLALGAAAVAYRIEAPRIDLDHPASWASAPTSEDSSSARSPGERIDQ